MSSPSQRPAVPAPRAVFDPTRAVPERPLWVMAGLGLTGAGLTAAALFLWQSAAQQEIVSRSELSGVTALELRELGSNDVVVHGSDRSDVSVSRRIVWIGLPDGAPPLRENTTDRTLLIENPCAGRQWCWVSYTIEVPRSLTAKVSLRSGDVQARDLESLQVTASSGNVAVTDVATLDVRTESGDIDVCRVGAHGPVLLRAASGDVSACAVRGPIDIGTTSGEVDLDLAAGAGAPTVRVTTTSGDARLRLPAGAAYDVRTDTRSGTRRVSVPEDPDAAGRVSVATTSGDITVS